VQSLKLPVDWEESVWRLCQDQRDGLDPEADRKDIRSTIRLMRENYERGLYEGEEFQYWQKVSSLKEKLALLERVPEPATNRAAQTLLDLRETWENTTQEERKDLVRTMIQEAGCDGRSKRIMWVKVNPDFEILFRLMDGLRADTGRRYWIREHGAEVDICDTGEDKGRTATEVKIAFPMSHNVLTIVEGYVQ